MGSKDTPFFVSYKKLVYKKLNIAKKLRNSQENYEAQKAGRTKILKKASA